MNFEAAERVKVDSIIRLFATSMKDLAFILQTQSSECNFGDQLQERLRDRLISGIIGNELQRKLLFLTNACFREVGVACKH